MSCLVSDMRARVPYRAAVDVDARARRPGEPQLLQSAECIAHRSLVQRHHRVAIVLLIAGIHQRVQRQRIVIRRRDVFFDQRAQYARLDVIQHDIH